MYSDVATYEWKKWTNLSTKGRINQGDNSFYKMLMMLQIIIKKPKPTKQKVSLLAKK